MAAKEAEPAKKQITPAARTGRTTLANAAPQPPAAAKALSPEQILGGATPAAPVTPTAAKAPCVGSLR